MMRSRPRRIITAILVACAVDACGYHLQGATELPDVMSVTLIDAPDPHTDFVRGLNRSLADNGVQVTQDLDAATARRTGQWQIASAGIRCDRCRSGRNPGCSTGERQCSAFRQRQAVA